MFEKRLNIFTGHFGSGKTEVAVNSALQMAAEGNKTAILDFDIVNPYFRTADVKELLSEKGIWVMTTTYANTNVDVPAIPAEVNSLFVSREYKVVFDVGGVDIGARALSRYREESLDDDYEMFFVININRPMTDSVEKIKEMMEEIELSSRLKITKLVNNTNLLSNTTGEDIIKGQDYIREVSEKLSIPVAFTCGFYDIVDSVKDRIEGRILYLERLIKLPWE
jgi:hypothetical protein